MELWNKWKFSSKIVVFNNQTIELIEKNDWNVTVALVRMPIWRGDYDYIGHKTNENTLIDDSNNKNKYSCYFSLLSYTELYMNRFYFDSSSSSFIFLFRFC